MLQQTRMEVVLRYFDRFAGRFPTVASLASSPDEHVLAAWSGLGYYRRARMLAAGAREVVERFAGEIPRDTASLRSLPGIGRYTAGAIASIAFGQREPVVDGNVARVLARIYAIETQVMTAAWRHAAELIERSADPRAFNQGLMELGALVCTPQNPDCPKCPIRKHCTAYATDRVESFPPPKEKRIARKEIVPLYLIDDGRGHLLMRRDLTSMLHLPQGPLDGVVAKALVGSFRHTITTRNIVFEVHRASLTRIADSSDYTWVDPSKLSELPHPSYVAKALRMWSAAAMPPL